VDIANLFRYALSNETLYELVIKPRHSTASTDKHADGITFHSTLFSRMSDPAFEGGMILGGKTGFTDEAGLCLASFAIKDGRHYILATSGAMNVNQTPVMHIDDALTVYSAIK
jgi:D-alanyl-D-alanine carboxypeptidase (penicillin-binding protein 5/6)